MQRSWEISGAYANWKMTVDVDAPDELDQTDLRHWRESDLDSLAAHFHEAVYLFEANEQCERSA